MLNGLTILIVEDEPMVAMCLAHVVEDHGGKVLGPVATVAEGLDMIADGQAAGAILDANLLDRDVTPLALRLLAQGVPIVVHTGTGLPAELAETHPDLPVVMKPVLPEIVVRALAAEIEGSRGR